MRWQEVMAQYLATRAQLAGIVMLIDSRLGFTPLDLHLLDFVAPRVHAGEVRLLAVLTKTDKLNRSEAQAALATAQQALGPHAAEPADVSVTLFSALSRQGVGDVAETVHAWALAHRAAAQA
jgi:GTP-binding protein